MIFDKFLWYWPQVHNEYKEYEKEFLLQSIKSHEIYIQN